MKHIPLYTKSRESAAQCGELEIWKKSHHANKVCAKVIELEISQSFDESSARRILDEYGFNRVNWVLQTTIQQNADIHPDHQEWSKGAFTHYLHYEMQEYKVNVAPAVLNSFIIQARQAWHELGLLDATHCLPNDSSQDYHGKVLVIRPGELLDEYKNPKDQLFYCTGGFGASAYARGRKVYGQFLSDREECQFERQDFIGVLRDEHLPDWARDTLEQLRQPEKQIHMEEPSL